MASMSVPDQMQLCHLCPVAGAGVRVLHPGQDPMCAHHGYSAEYKDYFTHISEAGTENMLWGSVY